MKGVAYHLEYRTTAEYKDLSPEETQQILGTSPSGLSDPEALRRMQVVGPNMAMEKRVSPVLQFLSRYWGPMPWLLELTIVLSYILGHYLETVIIFILLGINAVISFWNEHNSRRALGLLKSRLSVKSRLLRNGRWVTRDAKEIVPGDVVAVGLGDIVSADIKIIGDGTLSVDQSALTGESLPVALGRSSIAYSGSIVKQGEGMGIVLNTGPRTYFGKTIELVSTAQTVSHQQEIMLAIVRYMIYVSIGALVLIGIFAIAIKMSFTSILLIVLIFLMGAVPVALPAVFTVVLATGAMELSRKNVLVTKLSAIEDAASMSILLLDKTGTVTQNRLSVAEPVAFGDYSKNDVLVTAVMASNESSKELIDTVVLSYTRENLKDLRYRQVSFTPFDPARKRTEAVIEEKGTQFKVMKGAFQTILALCKVEREIHAQAEAVKDQLSGKGYRILAVARSEKQDMENLRFVGLLPLADPPRHDSKAMIEEMKRLGIRIKMLTGDNRAIAAEIARQVSIGDNIVAITELKKLDEKRQTELLETIDGIAEIYPEDKYHIVKMLQSKKNIVGMTGDGVNDAPALKQAEVGIAVSNATDIAKASASIVLTQEGIQAITTAVEISRQIYQRMFSWVVNKVTKVIQVIGILTLGFLLFHQVLLTAMGMVLLVFANDFVTMSLATDHAIATVNPDIWNVRKITWASVFIGLLLIVEGLIAILIGRHCFHMPFRDLQSFMLLLLVFTSQVKIIMVRERRHFWSSMPGKMLLVSSGTTMVLFIILGIYGFIIPPLTPYQVAVAFVYSISFMIAIDYPKYLLFRK